MCYAVVFLLILFTNYHVLSTSSEVCKKSLELMKRIDKSLHFFEENYQEINFDGLVGFQMLQEALKEVHEASKCHLDTKLGQIVQRLIRVNSVALTTVTDNDPVYVEKLKKTVDHFVQFKSSWKHIKGRYNTSIDSSPSTSDYDEEKGDTCFSALYKENCHVSDSCFKFFFSNGNTKGYLTTHIVIYLMVYKQMKCYNLPERRLSHTSVDEMINNLCLGILQDNEDLMKSKPNKIAEDLDLFAERIMLCGGKVGFLEFFSNNAIKIISLSQDPQDGCVRESYFLSNFEIKSSNEETIPMKRSFHNKFTHMTKRRSSMMKDGCSSHFFGLASACFGYFLKYLLR